MSPKILGGRWEVVGPLDEGGQGWIYEVRDISGELDQPLVLKRLKNPSKRLRRFEREIEAQRQLKHESIAPVLDFSLDDTPYFVTPLYKGGTLEKVGKLRPLEALDAFSKLCDVVHYAHQEGVVHRDLKPSNVILTNDNQIVVLDFGLCYFEDEDNRLTETMEQIGSRFYIAPELESGRADSVTASVDC